MVNICIFEMVAHGPLGVILNRFPVESDPSVLSQHIFCSGVLKVSERYIYCLQLCPKFQTFCLPCNSEGVKIPISGFAFFTSAELTEG